MSKRNDVHEIAGYVGRLLAAAGPRSAVGLKLGNWIRQNETLLGFDFDETISSRASTRKRAQQSDKPLSDASWKKLSRAVSLCASRSEPSQFARNANVLATVLQFSELEAALFVLVATASYQSPLDNLFEQISETRAWTPEELLGVLLSTHPAEISAALVRGSFAAMKLIEGVGDRPGRFGLFVSHRVLDALRPPISDLEGIERVLLGAPAETDLAWDDFAHISAERDFTAKLLRGALDKSRGGINVLLYGAPGTGKTELAKVVAREIGSPLYSVGESDEYGEEPSRFDRLSELRLCDRLLKRRKGACLLFDEMEDLLQKGDAANIGGRQIRRAGSKVFLNRLLERNSTPIIWTANSLEEFDPAFLRRMSFAFEMKTPSKKVRSRVWVRNAQRHNLILDSGTADTLARRHRISPALVRSALEAVVAADAPEESLDFVAGKLAKAADGTAIARQRTPIPCDPELLNPDRDLGALERKLSPETLRVSFCLHGPSGTGKSGYARRLAEKLNLDILQKKGSDLLSKWVGGTERLIAEAFEEAAGDGRFLIIDEAETLFWRREDASRSWEVGMVNEFLVGMEEHPLPIACTTNQLSSFDKAALRRFTFKLKFDFLESNQMELAFEKFFGVAPPTDIRQLRNASPGDFAVVKRQLDFMDPQSPAEILDLLAQEVAAKSLSPQRIGF